MRKQILKQIIGGACTAFVYYGCAVNQGTFQFSDWCNEMQLFFLTVFFTVPLCIFFSEKIKF